MIETLLGGLLGGAFLLVLALTGTTGRPSRAAGSGSAQSGLGPRGRGEQAGAEQRERGQGVERRGLQAAWVRVAHQRRRTLAAPQSGRQLTVKRSHPTIAAASGPV